MRLPAIGALLAVTLTAATPPNTPAPVATPIVSSGAYAQVSRPLPVTFGPPVTFARVAAPAAAVNLDAVRGRFVGNAGEFAVFSDRAQYDSKGAIARFHFSVLDVLSGTRAWEWNPTIDTGAFDAEPQFAFGTNRLYFPLDGKRTDVLSARTGKVLGSIPCAPANAVIDNVLYCSALSAYDATSLAPLWHVPLDSRTQGAPVVAGSILLQSETGIECAGPCFPALYAYDRATGRQLWSHSGKFLGFEGGRVYIDDTRESLLDYYVPLTVATVDRRTGRVLNTADYTPDPERNAAANDGTNVFAAESAVSGGYVYATVNDALYRYDADRAPGIPARIDDVEPLAWFEHDNVLVRTKGHVAVAHVERDRLVVRQIPGQLRTVVRAGEGRLAVPEQAGLPRIYERNSLVRGAGESAYVIAGDDLIEFDRFGNPRALGVVTCPAEHILSWKRRAAVLCVGPGGGVNRALVFIAE